MEAYSQAARWPAKPLVRAHLRMAVNKPHGLNTDCDQTRLHFSLGYRTPNEVHQEWRKTETAA